MNRDEEKAAEERRTENGPAPDGASPAGGRFGPGYYLRCVILPAAAGLACVVFGFTKEPEIVDSWSRLWMLANRQPAYAGVFGGFLLYLAGRAYLRARAAKK